jgi:hypothetical protein
MIASIIDRLWPTRGAQAVGSVGDRGITADGGAVYDAVRELSPKNDVQKTIQAQALQVGADLAKTRWTLSQPAGPLLPTPFLVVLVFWLGVLFASFGLLTPCNPTVVATLLICALSLSGAIFLVADLGEPLHGLIRISDESLRYALSQLGQ